MSKFAVILPAAGKSSRFRDKNYKKPYAPLGGRAVWLHTADLFLNRSDVAQVIIVISAEDREMFQMKFGANIAILGVNVVEGGATRTESITAALNKVSGEVDYIAVHDAVRPCVAEPWIDQVFAAATQTGAAILATPVTSTLKSSPNGKTIDQTVSRENLWAAQTPQVFRRQLLLDAYAKRGGQEATDDAQLVEMLGHPVSIVEGSPLNLKITTRDDLKMAEMALKVLPRPKLDGPAHPFADGDLWR
ncbi:MAG: 2-C-methyl-D-erythritol 4-phosphate cytidylyltransferase [Planctomycetales bacterium]|nr:2-C-methyl-D-erythritol 4-phosphate cytidylyltransferase [Planctomycetales bacterium]